MSPDQKAALRQEASENRDKIQELKDQISVLEQRNNDILVTILTAEE